MIPSERTATRIVRIAKSEDLGARFADVPLEPPVRIFESSDGVFLSGLRLGVSAAIDRCGSSFDIFEPTSIPAVYSQWSRVDDGLEELPSRIPAERVLLLTDRDEIELPLPSLWPPIESALGWKRECASLPWIGSIRPIELVPVRARGPRIALVVGRGRGAQIGDYISRASAVERRDLWRGDAGSVYWIWSPRGLAAEFPRVGRALLNLARPLEPVLLPCNRAVRPVLGARALRVAFGLEEGDGLVWWDGSKGEQRATFRRSDLLRLDDPAAQSLEW
jgi:hypothetical protein